MRCECCNRLLSDYESTLRHAVSRDFLDTCLNCLDGLDIPYTGRPDLEKTSVNEDFDEQEEDSF